MSRRSQKPRLSVATTLCLIRHGDAGDPSPIRVRDAARRLTPKGKRQARWAGKALARLSLAPRDVWSSRLVRAKETAALALEAVEVRLTTTATDALSPGADPAEIVRLLAATAAPGKRSEGGPVVRWLVGHEPHLSRLVHWLTGAHPSAVRFGKGATAVIDGPHGLGAGACHLTALLPPSALREIRHSRR